MKVVAIAKGYYGSMIRDPGDEFVLASKDDFSEEWMKKAETATKGRRKADPEQEPDAGPDPEAPADE